MPSHAVFMAGHTALITGGANGIGLALATKCIGYGMNVIIADNNKEYLDIAIESLNESHSGSGQGKVIGEEVDVSRVEDFERLKGRVEEEFGGKIHLLALNAGMMLKGSWDDPTYFQKIMSVNLFGVINGLSTLLPLVTSSSSSSSSSSGSDEPSGSIIITGSKQGITNPPGNPAYNASKAAVKSLAEHLSFDLAKSSPTTSVHLLIPGWTFTGLSGNVPGGQAKDKKEKPAGAWSPEQVVEYLEAKMGEGAFYVVCPDGDVSEEMDRKRMLWATEEIIRGEQPLSRWREGGKKEAEDWMAQQKV